MVWQKVGKKQEEGRETSTWVYVSITIHVYVNVKIGRKVRFNAPTCYHVTIFVNIVEQQELHVYSIIYIVLNVDDLTLHN